MMSTDDTPALSIEDVEALLRGQFPPEPEPEPFPGDPDATWTYWTDLDTADRGVPDEWVWERLRLRRDQLLRDTDYMVLPDNPRDGRTIRDYRQALRDLPETTTNPRRAAWPAKP
jgi:hypothetical protein